MSYEKGKRYGDMMAAVYNSNPFLKRRVRDSECNPYPEPGRTICGGDVPIHTGNIGLLKTFFCKREDQACGE